MSEMVPVGKSTVAEVVRRSTGIDLSAFRQRDPETLLLVLMFLFKGLLENTFNGDAVVLAKYRAADLLKDSLDQEEVFYIADDIIRGMRRKPSVLDPMFDQKGMNP